jgi:predicted O-methyltransferase YrrM
MKFNEQWFEEAHLGSWPNWLKQCLRGKPKRVLEIGCHEGASTVWLLKNLAPEEMVCVDPWADPICGPPRFERWKANIAETGLADRVTVHQRPSREVLPYLPPFSFDLIYIDGDHRVEEVAFDTEHAMRLAHHEGIIIWDDYYYETPVTPDVRDGVAIGLHAWNVPPQRIVHLDRSAVLFK